MFAAKTLSKMVPSGLTFGEHCVKLGISHRPAESGVMKWPQPN